MKTASLISAILTAMLLLSTMVCGLWMTANNITNVGSINFHITCGVASVVFCLITLALLIAQLGLMRKKG